MLNIEGLGRQLDPDLDLWKTAKPYLERWMAEQVGWRGMAERLKAEAPRFGQILPQLPRLVHQVLHKRAYSDLDMGDLMAKLVDQQRRTNRLLAFLACVTGVLTVIVVGLEVAGHLHWTP
jgi:ubiquinone biosynthesis protein